MKFLQALILIYLIGVDAKIKGRRDKSSRAASGKKLIDGSRGLEGRDVPQTERSPFSETGSSVDHGNIVDRLPRYGHFGLNAAGSDGNNHKAVQASDEHRILSDSIQNVGSTDRSIGQKYKSRSGWGGPQYRLAGIFPELFDGGRLARQYQTDPVQGGRYGFANEGSIALGQLQGLVQTPIQIQPAGYFGFAANGQGVNWGPSIPENYLGYSTFGNPPGYPVIGVVNVGQSGQFDVPKQQGNTQAWLSTIGQPAKNGAAVSLSGRQSGRFRQSVLGQNSQGGHGNLPVTYYDQMENGSPWQSGLQGPYSTSISKAAGSNTNVQGGGQVGFLSWIKSLFSSGRRNNRLLSNPCPVGYGKPPSDERCMPYCTTSQTTGCIINDAGRYISSGFYYPPPQHLHSDPNVWDQAAPYFFSLSNEEPLRQQPSPRLPPSYFPTAYYSI